jgi:hypothetical protein
MDPLTTRGMPHGINARTCMNLTPLKFLDNSRASPSETNVIKGIVIKANIMFEVTDILKTESEIKSTKLPRPVK